MLLLSSLVSSVVISCAVAQSSSIVPSTTTTITSSTILAMISSSSSGNSSSISRSPATSSSSQLFSASVTSSPTVAPTPPPNLWFKSSKPFQPIGLSPFFSIQSLAFENNWLLAAGSHKDDLAPNGTLYDEIWITRTNYSGSWILGWAANQSSLNPNATLKSNKASYESISVKHAPLQITQSLLFLLNTVASTLDVFTFWWHSPIESPDPNFAPRSIPLPVSGNSVRAITHLDNNFGVFACAPQQVWWIRVTDTFSPAPPPDTTITTNSTQWPSKLILTSYTRNASLHLQYFPGSFSTCFISYDFYTLYVVENSPDLFTTRIWSVPISGPSTTPYSTGDLLWANSTSANTNTNTTSTSTSPSTTNNLPPPSSSSSNSTVLIPQVLATLNNSFFPILPRTPSYTVHVSCVAVHPSNQQIYLGLAVNMTATLQSPPTVTGVMVLSNSGDLIGWINTSFVNVRSMDINTASSILFIAGDDGNGNGAVDSLDISGGAQGKGNTAHSIRFNFFEYALIGTFLAIFSTSFAALR